MFVKSRAEPNKLIILLSSFEFESYLELYPEMVSYWSSDLMLILSLPGVTVVQSHVLFTHRGKLDKMFTISSLELRTER